MSAYVGPFERVEVHLFEKNAIEVVLGLALARG
jgi:hypothetical protein